MLKGIASDLVGKADVCHPVRDFARCLATEYLLPSETIMMSLQSGKEEFTFTNEALIAVVGENATTTRKLVTRYEFKTEYISKVQFETAGHADRDCEIKFTIGSMNVSIDVAKAEDATARVYYKVLLLLARDQYHNMKNWEFAKDALARVAEAMRLTEQSGQSLTTQADAAGDWIKAQYAQYNQRCYRDVILRAFQLVQGGGFPEVGKVLQ